MLGNLVAKPFSFKFLTVFLLILSSFLKLFILFLRGNIFKDVERNDYLLNFESYFKDFLLYFYTKIYKSLGESNNFYKLS